MHAIKEVCYFYHSPKFGPAKAMLIGRLCYYRGGAYRGLTVLSYDDTVETGEQDSYLI